MWSHGAKLAAALAVVVGVASVGLEGGGERPAAADRTITNSIGMKLVKIPPGGGLETATVLTNSINGADGLLIDEDGNIWVCANQSDEIVVIDPTGKAIAKLGDFDGISERGEARGFLFPASPVFAGEFVLVTNLALDTNLFGFNSVDAGWAAQVKTYTVSKIKRRIPPIHGD